ncbi:DUF354 domain-containing protein [Methanogenium cariaci]|uniref:DUF354 domain-containing protein n=1 Tax=Methanogenium cariaci TaxID=2197 RepID=UPI0007835E4E|nr:DUF354 domain-containing protein [Methanogenium cariaci]
MKILIDIGHPAHVHFFKGTVKDLSDKGHEILMVTRNKEMTVDLLKKYEFNYITVGEHQTSMTGKALALLQFDYRIYQVAKNSDPIS